MAARIVCLVEGHGEVAAVPVLIRRIANLVTPALAPDVSAIRIPRNRIIRTGELERWVERSGRQAHGEEAVLILLDSDQDCPAELGPTLLQRAVQVREDVPIAVVLAKQEFEAWFLAAAESLRGHRSLPRDLEPPPDPENVSAAKEWLRQHMPRNRKYEEPRDQPALAALFDLEVARQRSDSFDKCYREIVRLLTELQGRQTPAGPAEETP